MSIRPAASVTIEAARPEDEPAIRALLEEARLPTEDFAAHLDAFLVARRADRVVGAVGMERYGPDALLRSLVVAPESRGGGLGRALLEQIEDEAERRGVQTFYLLTTTAEDYFVRRGFRHIARSEVPPAIGSTREFAALCPASSACLARTVRP